MTQLHEAPQMVRNRAGRKRKQGRRHPSGDIALPHVDPRLAAAHWPHRRGLPEGLRLHELAETPFGCLHLIGAITGQQHRAGELYRGAVRRYLASIQPPSMPPSIAGWQQPGAGGQAPDGPDLRDSYDAAFASMHGAGHAAQRAVARVAVHGFELESGQLPYLIRGLDALIDHYGLTAGRKRARPVGK